MTREPGWRPQLTRGTLCSRTAFGGIPIPATKQPATSISVPFTGRRGKQRLLEALRAQTVNAAFTGFRLTGRWPLVHTLVLSTELELAIPDDGGQRGDLWPWGKLALAWEPIEHLEVAAAAIAGSSPESEFQFSALARVSYSLEVR